MEAIAEEAHEGGHEHHHGKGEIHESETGGPAEDLAEVAGGGEVVELDLRDVEGGLEGGGVLREIEICAGEGLNPYSGHQQHPLPRLARHGHTQFHQQTADVDGSRRRRRRRRRRGGGGKGFLEIGDRFCVYLRLYVASFINEYGTSIASLVPVAISCIHISPSLVFFIKKKFLFRFYLILLL